MQSKRVSSQGVPVWKGEVVCFNFKQVALLVEAQAADGRVPVPKEMKMWRLSMKHFMNQVQEFGLYCEVFAILQGLCASILQ